MSPEQLMALGVAREARERLQVAQKDYEAAMRQAFGAGLAPGTLARALHMRYDAVRMYRKRLR